MKQCHPLSRRKKIHHLIRRIVFFQSFLGVIWWNYVELDLLHHRDAGPTSHIIHPIPRAGDVTPWPVITGTKWCRSKRATPGLIYVKVPKTGSSTLVGINIRIARKIGMQKSRVPPWFPWGHPKPCSTSYRHGRSELLGRQRPYLLWSFLRDPAARGLSEFYHFEVSRKGRRPTDTRVKLFLNSRKNYQFEYLADHSAPKTLLEPNFPNANTAVDIIHRYVLEPFHFIGVLERKLESLAVLKLLWGLQSSDLIVLDSKKSGGYDDGRFNGTCIRIQSQPMSISELLQQYMDESFPQGNIDYMLYKMVNQTLDKTIQRLGVHQVNVEVEKLKSLQWLVEQKCQPRAIFPCSVNGTLQWEAASKNCYWTDSGCGFACVDEVLSNVAT